MRRAINSKQHDYDDFPLFLAIKWISILHKKIKECGNDKDKSEAVKNKWNHFELEIRWTRSRKFNWKYYL